MIPAQMEGLSDDVVGQILNKVKGARDRRSCAQVCAQWRRMEGFTRQNLRMLDAQFMQFFIPRFPNLIKVEADVGLSDADLALLAENCRSLQVVNLNFAKSRRMCSNEEEQHCDVGDEGVCALAMTCRDLRHVSLRWRQKVRHASIAALARCCCSLSHLDLAHCNGITDKALEAVSGAARLEVLILRSCTAITDKGLSSLVGSCAARSLRILDLSECDRLTDAGIVLLQQFSSLRSLNLAECGARITDAGGVAIAGIPKLQNLNLSWLVNISDVSILAISHGCAELKGLDLSGCELVSGVGLHAFIGHKSLENLTLYSCYGVASDEVEQIGLGCPALRYLGLDRSLRGWLGHRAVHRLQCHLVIHWL